MSEIVSSKVINLPDGGKIHYFLQWNVSRHDTHVRTIVTKRIHIDPNGNELRSVSNDGCWKERKPGDDGYLYYYNIDGVRIRLEPNKVIEKFKTKK